MKNHPFYLVICLLCLLFLWGCPTTAPPPKPETPLVPLAVSDYPRFGDDLAYEGLEQSIRQSLVYLNRVPADREFTFGPDTYTAAHLIRSLERFRSFIASKPSDEALQGFIRGHYRVYQSIGEPDTGKVLFTGYFEPLLDGSLTETPEYRYPIYGPPEDIAVVDLGQFSSKLEGERIIGRVEGKTFVPYYGRQEIDEEGALEDIADVLVWVNDPVELFFLHIQGSGKVLLPDGRTVNVHYHSKNGRPYRSIGTLLIQEEKISAKEMSMQRLVAYLNEHPEERSRVFNYNPSYIFFSLEEEGPKGALSVVLTPGRSMAVDRTVFPLSALSFIQAQKPVVKTNGEIDFWQDFSRFILNQDTGGAIKGPGRGDIFWGNGDYAEIAAGHLKHRGTIYVLVLKPEA